MGDGSVRKVAVIVNGSGAPEHLEDVERAGKLFAASGYSVHVASPREPSFTTDSYRSATRASLGELIDGLRTSLRNGDDLVIYTTGEGSEKKDGCLQLEDTCLSKDSYTFGRLFSLPHGKRTVIMTQHFGENWARLFAGDPLTLFLSGNAGKASPDNRFDRLLLQPDSHIPDRDERGSITWAERYANAVNHLKQGMSVFIPNRHYSDTGLNGGLPEPAHFEPTVHEVSDPETLKAHLSRLQPDDAAIVMMSAPWCGPCKQYAVEFSEAARNGEGRALRLYVPNADDDRWESLKVHMFPTFFLIDGQGRKASIWDFRDPLAERWKITGAHMKEWGYCLAQIKDYEGSFKSVHESLKTKREFVLEAVRRNWKVLRHVGPLYQKDPEIVMLAMRQNVRALKLADVSLKKNPTFMLRAIRENCFALDFADPALKDDPTFMRDIKRLKANTCAVGHIPRRRHET